MRHGDDVVAGVDVVDLAGRARRKIRKEIEARAADLLDRHGPTQRRVPLLIVEHQPRVGDARARQSADGSGGDRVHADAVRPVIGGEIAHRRFESRLRHAHHVVVRHHADGARISERHHAAAVRHQRRGALGDLREGEAGDEHGPREILAGGVRIAALEFVLVGEGDRMDEEVELPPLLLDRREDGVHRGEIFDVAREQDVRADAFGERLHALPQRLALIGEGELRPLVGERLGDSPSDRMIIGDAHDQSALALHESGHDCSFEGPVRRRGVRLRAAS